MCGIFGVVGGSLPDRTVTAVIELLRHRGPDDAGAVRLAEGILAHTRLAIIDLSESGRQPMVNVRGTVTIVHNGEVYNYVELRKELEEYPFRTDTDTEVILAAYERWGEEFLKRLRGMFAFALWDADRRKLICATDRFSIKPLYYCRDGQRLIFSSEIKPFRLAGIPLRPNDATIYDYLAFGLLDHDDATLFQGIHQLRPATYLTFQNGELAIQKYWDLEAGPVFDSGATEASVGEVEERLLEAVRLHLRGDVEVGLSLSSGLDSNLLRALVGQVTNSGRVLQCFTFGFPGTPYDEVDRAERIPGDDQCAYYSVDVSPDGVVEGLRSLVHVVEEPAAGLSIYGYWLTAKLAADHGIKVLLDGQGADETFAGYRYYYEAKIRQLWERGWREEAIEEFGQLTASHQGSLGSFEQMISRKADEPLIRAPDSTSLASDYLLPDFAARFEGRRHEFPPAFDCAVKSAMYTDLFFLKIPKLLRFQDRCAMAWGVEVRVPYLDHPLVETLFSIPAAVLLGGGLTKTLLRGIARKYTRVESLGAPKLYVASPQREWIKTALSGPIRTMIGESHLVQAAYIGGEELLRQFDAYCASPELGNSFFIWKFLNLELWYRMFFTE